MSARPFDTLRTNPTCNRFGGQVVCKVMRKSVDCTQRSCLESYAKVSFDGVWYCGGSHTWSHTKNASFFIFAQAAGFPFFPDKIGPRRLIERLSARVPRRGFKTPNDLKYALVRSNIPSVASEYISLNLPTTGSCSEAD